MADARNCLRCGRALSCPGCYPSPDTDRADAAERMLAAVMVTLRDHGGLYSMKYSNLFEGNPGLQSWWLAWLAKHRRIECLTADLARLDAERERVARELAAITTTENASR